MSKIEWTERTWNPIVGCSVISPGCTNCYAMRQAGRIQKMNPTGGSGTAYVNHYDGTTAETSRGKHVWTGKVALAPDSILHAPLRRLEPTTYFVNSMGDLFHESVPDDWIDKVFAIMALSPQHTFQVLTKRSKCMWEYMTKPVQGPWAGRAHVAMDNGDVVDMTDARWRLHSTICNILPKVPARQVNLAAKMQEPHGDGFAPRWPLPNVWLGVSAEDQKWADERIPDLLGTPAGLKFISAEPLLGPIYFYNYFHTPLEFSRAIDWIIVGGESGHGARPMDPDWARSIRDQCDLAGVPFFMKQMGGPVKSRMPPIPDDLMIRQMPELGAR